MRQFRPLPIAVCLLAMGLSQLCVGQDQGVLVPQDATYDYLFTIKDIGGTGLAVNPNADANFSFMDPGAPESGVPIWAFPGYDTGSLVSGEVRDNGNPESLEWRQGEGPFHYGTINGLNQANGTALLDAALPGFTEDQVDGQKLTQYFRTEFEAETGFATLLLDVLIDDGAVFYIDGQEVARYNCCADVAGLPAFDGVASGVGNETDRSQFTIDLSLLGGSLTAGPHVLAYSVHSYDPFTSSDLGADVLLTGTNEENQWVGASGSWTNGANWSLGVANGVNAVANLLQTPTTSTTIYHNGGITLGELTIDNTNKYAISGLGVFTFENTEGDAGISVMSGDHEFQAPVALNTNANVDVAAGASLEFNNDLRLNGNNLVLGGAGTVSVNNAVFADGGAIAAAAGAMVGSGTIHGDLINSGATVSPGDGIGVLTVDGDFAQNAEGVIEIEIESSTSFDQLAVTGELDFGGTFVVSVEDGYVPQLGDEFAVFTFASSAGEFSEIITPELANGLAFDATTLYETGNLAIVPEPGSVLMLLFGVSGLVMLRRRQS